MGVVQGAIRFVDTNGNDVPGVQATAAAGGITFTGPLSGVDFLLVTFNSAGSSTPVAITANAPGFASISQTIKMYPGYANSAKVPKTYIIQMVPSGGTVAGVNNLNRPGAETVPLSNMSGTSNYDQVTNLNRPGVTNNNNPPSNINRPGAIYVSSGGTVNAPNLGDVTNTAPATVVTTGSTVAAAAGISPTLLILAVLVILALIIYLLNHRSNGEG